ncbi:hypothetical protein WR25_05939 [Diploscapter pachys]|uniref:Uncharacterized protein n=1 Tax=Diploscapter pachys TaxID=2018661 RepID=A0A2A2L5U4_9BILA|nr:hypothetical protein WR25_05939 [Diploscapter pachys]
MENYKKKEGCESGSRLTSLQEEIHADRTAGQWKSDKAELTRLNDQLNQVTLNINIMPLICIAFLMRVFIVVLFDFRFFPSISL